MVKLIIIFLIIANVLAVLFLSPLVLLQLLAKIIYRKSADFLKKYFNYRKKIELAL